MFFMFMTCFPKKRAKIVADMFLQDVLPPLPTTALPSELQPPNMNDYPDFKEDLLCVEDQLDLPVFQRKRILAACSEPAQGFEREAVKASFTS